MDEVLARWAERVQSGEPCVAVTVVDATGSVPVAVGSRMLVTSAGLDRGTVGGGKLERRALDEAAAMLQTDGGERTRFVSWSLGRDIGMTCGGTVRLYFERSGAAEWTVAIFGAGHVAQALVRLLATLPCRVLLFDSRPEWLAKLPTADRLTATLTADLPAALDGLPDRAFVLLMTMGHGTDLPILRRLTEQNRPFPYVGVIGSRAKAARLRKELDAVGLGPGHFTCPMGLDLGGNAPAEIAVSIAAQLLQLRDRPDPHA